MGYNEFLGGVLNRSRDTSGETVGSALVSSVIGGDLTPIREKAEEVVESAKDKLAGPLSALARVVNKAIPAAIAACASLQYTGGVGSFANFLQPITLRTKYFYLDGSRAAFIGRPLNSTRVLNTLSGFVQCENVKLELSGATIYEQQLVKSYLEKGCYIE